MSLAALAIVLTHIAFYGITREADEGTAAHLFQLLIAAQAPLIAVSAIKSLRRSPDQAARVLLVQAAANPGGTDACLVFGPVAAVPASHHFLILFSVEHLR
jgi:hypothetical protein